MSARVPGSRESRLAVAGSYVAVFGFWVAVIAVTGFVGGMPL